MGRKWKIGLGLGVAALAVGSLLYYADWKVKERHAQDRNLPPSGIQATPPSEAGIGLNIPQGARIKTPQDPNTPRRTHLPVKLISTLSVGDGSDSRSSAMIQSNGSLRGSGVQTYVVGEEQSFWSGVKITRILPNRVEFLHDKAREYLELDTSSSPSTYYAPPKQDGFPETGLGIQANFGSTRESSTLIPPTQLYIPKQMPNEAFSIVGNLRPAPVPRAASPSAPEKNAKSEPTPP